MVSEKFQILGIKITGKYVCELKNLIYLFIFTHLSKQKYPPQILIITTPGRRKLPVFPKHFFLNLFFLSKKGEGLWNWKNDQN